MRVTPYLVFNGDCQEAFRFYEKTLGGKIEAMMPHRGTPAEGHVPAEWQDKIMHACLSLGGDSRLMASDAPPGMYQKPQGCHVSLHPETVEEAERIYAALMEGGTATMPIGETFWAKRFAMLVDRYGTQWMLNCE